MERMRRYPPGEVSHRLLTIAVVVLAVCALILTAVNVWATLWPSRQGGERSAEIVQGWREYAAEGHRVAGGAVGGGRTLVVFSDYECPICRHLDSRLRVLPDDARRGLTIVWRHFPLEGHLAAVPAA